MSLLFNMLSTLVITFLPRSKCLLISWLQSPFAVILEPQKIKSDTVSTVSPSICHEVMGPDAMILIFWMLSFKPTFSLSSFTFIKRLFSSSSLSAIRVVSSSYLRLLIDWFKLGKKYVRAVYYHPAYLTSMQSSVQLLSQVQLFAIPWTAVRFPCLSLSFHVLRDYSNSCPLSQWCHPTISSSVQSASCKMPGWMKHKLESRLPEEISMTSGASEPQLKSTCAATKELTWCNQDLMQQINK